MTVEESQSRPASADPEQSDKLLNYKVENKERLITKTYHALAAVAWCSKQFGWNDMDDYIQTILIGESLIANRGFNHRDLVRRYRTKPGHIVDGHTLLESGIDMTPEGSIGRLLKAFDMDYQHDGSWGYSDGSAMKVACIAPYFLEDFEKLVAETDRITRVTHNFPNGRMASLIIVLRFRQILLQSDETLDDYSHFRHSLDEAVDILGLQEEAAFFLQYLDDAADAVIDLTCPSEVLWRLSSIVGITHLSNSAPIAACLWSFKLDTRYGHYLKQMVSGDKFTMDGYEFSKEQFVNLEDSIQYYGRQGLDADNLRTHSWHLDCDTLLSIAYSLVAAKSGPAYRRISASPQNRDYSNSR
ncbi:MAG: ADP-ribosylglycohydrolase family protein [Verrucomicrobiota bacterium]